MTIASPALEATADLGPFPASDFVVMTGAAAIDAIPQARWYFRDEPVATPAPGRRVAGFARGVTFDDDLRAWAAAHDEGAPADHPSLVWMGAPCVVDHAALDADSGTVATDEGALPFRLAPKIPLNRSYFDASSAAFFRARRVKIRGTFDEATFIARTLWPEDIRLAALPPWRPLDSRAAPGLALRSRMRADLRGGAQSPFAAETLWRRTGTSGDLGGRSVVAFMVNGGQGDDDEAHAGHFALVTGKVQPDGAIGDWLANNFYTLESESEKGILAAPVPLDNYLADLNAGQAWYRPSYLVVAVLARPRAAALLQSALARVYNQFWRHQLVYYHPLRNCTSISVDTLRALGFPLPARASTPRPLAALGLPWLVLRERSLRKAMLACDYALADPVRLMPAAALEEITARLVELADGAPAQGTLEKMFATDLEALVYLQIPQLPSSRAVGDAPVVSLREYRSRLPRDPRDYKIVPVPPRPFPASLRDPDLLPQPASPSEVFLIFWLVLSVVGIPWAIARWRRRRKTGE